MAPDVGHFPCCAAGTVGGCGCPAKVGVAPCVGALCPCCPVRVVGWLRLAPWRFTVPSRSPCCPVRVVGGCGCPAKDAEGWLTKRPFTSSAILPQALLRVDISPSDRLGDIFIHRRLPPWATTSYLKRWQQHCGNPSTCRRRTAG